MINSTNLNSTQIIKYPIITDKAINLIEQNKYSFLIDRRSDKLSIKRAVEYLFDVKVLRVNTCNLPRKRKRVGKYIGFKTQYKKAIVTLADGDTITLFAEN